MRIKNFRLDDIPTLANIEQVAAQADGRSAMSEEAFALWLSQPELDAQANAFIITDDDDELNTWSQAGTLDGLEGEIAGYTIVQLRQDSAGYHFLCQGMVLPEYRRQHGGRILLVGAMNRARIVATEFEFEAEEEGLPIYFEALLPARDPSSPYLAARCEMQRVDEPVQDGYHLYRRELL